MNNPSGQPCVHIANHNMFISGWIPKVAIPTFFFRFTVEIPITATDRPAMTFTLHDLIPAFIVFQGLLFSIVLLTDSGPKKASNRYLSAFLLFLSAQFAMILAANTGRLPGWLEGIFCVYGFAYGPLLYLYTRSLIHRDFAFSPPQLLHLVPAAAFLAGGLSGLPFCRTAGFLFYLSLILYVTFSVRELVHYKKIIRETQSSMYRTNLVWLQWTLMIFCLALVLDLLDHTIWDMDLPGGISSIHLSILLLLNWMFYKGLKQPQIFLGITKSESEIMTVPENRRDGKGPDREEKADLDRIRNYMEESAIYTDEALSIGQLAEKLQMPSRRISFLINTYLDQNFMGFVNRYRIDMAKQRLADPKDEKETVAEVMYEAGFNSKSSFNTLFKQQTGQTPSGYKKSRAGKGSNS